MKTFKLRQPFLKETTIENTKWKVEEITLPGQVTSGDFIKAKVGTNKSVNEDMLSLLVVLNRDGLNMRDILKIDIRDYIKIAEHIGSMIEC